VVHHTPPSVKRYTVFFGEAAMKAAMQHPRALCDSMKKEDTFTIIWDSGASNCISFDKNDFVGPLTSVKGNAICSFHSSSSSSLL